MRSILGSTPRKKSIESDLSAADHTGWLYKEGERNKDFKRRFFVLHGTSVAYYKDQADAVKGASKGEFSLLQLSHIHCISKEAAALEANTVPLCFAADATSGRRYILFAETFSDKIGWMRALGAALGRRSGAARSRLEVYVREMTMGPPPEANSERDEGDEGGSAAAAAGAELAPRWSGLTEGMKLAQQGQKAAAQVSFDRALADATAAGDAACEVCVRYELGKFLVMQGAHVEAAHHFEAGLALGNKHAAGGEQQLKLQLAWCLGFNPSRIDESLKTYCDLLDEDLFCAAAFLDRGKLHIRLHDWEKALGDFSHAAALNKADANVYNDIGVCYFELGQQDQALGNFTQALQLNDRHAPSYSNRANCLKGLQKYAEADADYTKAIEIDNRNPKAFLSRAQLRETMKEQAGALADYERVVALQSRHEFALRKVLALSPDVDAAASHRGWLFKRGHMNPSYQRRYFLLHGAMVSYYESEEAVVKSAKPKGDPIVARITHVRQAQVSELSAEKASLAFQFESVEGKRFIVYAASADEKLGWLTALGRAVGGGHGAERQSVEKTYAELILTGEAKAGGAHAAQTGSASPAWALVAQGARHAQGGNVEEAKQVLEQASAAVGDANKTAGAYVCSQYLLGKLLSSRNQHMDAAVHLRHACIGAPASCSQIIKLQLAWSYWHSGRPDDAEGMYWEVLDDDVLCWQALVDRARMHLGLGDWAQALCDLAQVAAMGKADADVCNDLGVANFETGNDDAACKWFGEAISKNGNHAPAISNRANCLRRQGCLREAESDYTRAIEIDNTNPKAYLNRGMLLREQGMNSRAHRDFERALALDPGNAALQAELKKLTEKLAESGIGGAAGGRERAGSQVEGSAAGAAAEANAAGAAQDGPLRRERL